MFKIYELVSENTNDVYIGKTKQKLGARKSGHKSSYKRYVNGVIGTEGRIKYCSSFEVIKYGDFEIKEIESNVEEENVAERERYWIENTPNTLNKVIPGRTQKEWYYDTHEERKAKAREYGHTPKSKATKKIYTGEHREEINLKRVIYNSTRRPEINLAYNKRMAIPANRQKRRAAANTLKHCDRCSILISSANMSRHKKAPKCNTAQKARQIIFEFMLRTFK